MNGLEHEAWGALKGLGGLGILRLLWRGAPKAWALWQGRQKAAVEVRRVTVEEARQRVEENRQRVEEGRLKIDDTRQRADEDKAIGDQALSLIDKMEARIGHQDSRQDALELKTELLQKKVEDETEQRRIAWLSVEAAHLRADLADTARDKAMAEMRALQATNTELERRLTEMTALRAGDQRKITALQGQIVDNALRIAELQAKLDQFEHGHYELTLVEEKTSEQKEETHD